MDIKALGELLDAIAKAKISELNLETSDYKLQIRRPKEEDVSETKTPISDTTPNLPIVKYVSEPSGELEVIEKDNKVEEINKTPDIESKSQLVEVIAPIVGTFYSSASPESPPFAKKGDKVTPGTVLCIIEAMKLMNEIEAEVSGSIAEVLVQNEEPVEYGQVLFTIAPS